MADQQNSSANQNTSRQLGEVILRAWTDPAFLQQLQSDPKGTLQGAGVPVADGVNVQVLQESGQQAYLVIPQKPANLQVYDFRSDDVSWCWSYNALCSF